MKERSLTMVLKSVMKKQNRMSYCEKISSLPSFEHFEYKVDNYL